MSNKFAHLTGLSGFGSGGLALPSDPDFASIVVLARFDGADGATAYTEVGPLGQACTFEADAQLDTGIAGPFGGSGLSNLLLDGTADYAKFNDHADFTIGDGVEFTIEGWFYFHDIGSAVVQTLLSHAETVTADRAWMIRLEDDDELRLFMYDTTNKVDIKTSGISLVQDTWYFISADRDSSGDIRLYVDGVVKASVNYTGAIRDAPISFRIGSRGGTPIEFFNGSVDEVRFTVGVGRYGGAHSKPSAPFPGS
jgi:hypothetical protein